MMDMKRVPTHWKPILGFICAMMFAHSLAYGMEFESMFTTKEGTVIGAGADTDWSADYPMMATAVYYFQPQAGYEVAHVAIVEGTEETHCYGKKITYWAGTENFLLEGDAKIEKESDFLEGPVKIDYDSNAEKMILYGNENDPARLSYGNGQLRAEAETITITFERNQEGERIVKTLEAEKNKNSLYIKKESSSPPPLKRKVSPPR